MARKKISAEQQLKMCRKELKKAVIAWSGQVAYAQHELHNKIVDLDAVSKQNSALREDAQQLRWTLGEMTDQATAMQATATQCARDYDIAMLSLKEAQATITDLQSRNRETFRNLQGEVDKWTSRAMELEQDVVEQKNRVQNIILMNRGSHERLGNIAEILAVLHLYVKGNDIASAKFQFDSLAKEFGYAELSPLWGEISKAAALRIIEEETDRKPS